MVLLQRSVPLTCKNYFCFNFYSFSDENRFVVGFKDGHVAVWANSMFKSKKLFNNFEQSYNAALVQYTLDRNKIFAIGRSKARLHIMDIELNISKVVGHQFEDSISAMASSKSYIAIAGHYHTTQYNDVLIFDHDGNLVLVGYF